MPRQSTENIRRVYLNLSGQDSLREDNERLQALLDTSSRERDAALSELTATRGREARYRQALDDMVAGAERDASQMHDLQAQLREALEAYHRTHAEVLALNAYAQNVIRNHGQESAAQRNEIDVLNAQARASSARVEQAEQMRKDLEEENAAQRSEIDVLNAQARASSAQAEQMKEDIAVLQATIIIKTEYEARSAPMPSTSSARVTSENVSVNAQSRQARRETRRGPVTPPASPTPTPTTLSHSEGTSDTQSHTDVESEGAPPPPAVRTLRRGEDIRWTGFDYPRKHPVPDCLPARNGWHHFLGKGSNQFYTRFSCKYCEFRCREKIVKEPVGASASASPSAP
ncbi:hypothetical protein CVT25_007413 [Psilocybe cyanescens]|uniref:Uncharacterized protein n=1 Tax=Psilocybe cyanescens TaxID=93625 RepID=A0A409XG95_PSICY|nr:hypothetical protein CVT25_007413 [Psilocybe cyanescens]